MLVLLVVIALHDSRRCMKGLGVIYLRVERVESFLPFLVESFSAFFL